MELENEDKIIAEELDLEIETVQHEIDDDMYSIEQAHKRLVKNRTRLLKLQALKADPEVIF